MKRKLSEPQLHNQIPSACPKPGCGGTIFLPHEDGWQCFNCMKIVYRASDRLVKNNTVKRYSRDNN